LREHGGCSLESRVLPLGMRSLQLRVLKDIPSSHLAFASADYRYRTDSGTGIVSKSSAVKTAQLTRLYDRRDAALGGGSGGGGGGGEPGGAQSGRVGDGRGAAAAAAASEARGATSVARGADGGCRARLAPVTGRHCRDGGRGAAGGRHGGSGEKPFLERGAPADVTFAAVNRGSCR